MSTICWFQWFKLESYWPPHLTCYEVVKETIPPGTIGIDIDPVIFSLYIASISLAGIFGSFICHWVDTKLEIALINAEIREEAKRLSKMWHP